MNAARAFASSGSTVVSLGAARRPAGARVAVAVGDTLVRAGVRHLLGHCTPVATVMDVPPGASPLEAVRSLRPDVLVLSMGRSASQQLPILAQLGRLTRVIVLCGSRDAALAARPAAARVLVHGEFTKDDFVRSVMTVAGGRLAGQVRALKSPAVPHGRASAPSFASVTPLRPAVSWLSTREADVMRCIAEGMRNAEIATTLTLTQKTVKNHINRIFTKLGVETRTQAVLIWLEAAA